MRLGIRWIGLVLAVSVLAACGSAPSVIQTQDASAGDAPYSKFLVAGLLESFDGRRYIEQEVVKQLKEKGVDAVRLTAMTDSRTVLNRDTVVEHVKETGADAVLLVQLIDLQTIGEQKDARPEATYNYWPTYWYNVFEVELTEYTEPAYTQFTDQIKAAAAVYSVAQQERVWAIETDWTVEEELQPGMDYSLYVDEAKAIVNAASRARLLAR